MSASQQCPTSEELASFQNGQVETHLMEAIGHHLETCLACRTKLICSDDHDALTRAVRQSANLDGFATETDYQKVVALVAGWHTEQTQETTRERPRLQPAEPGTASLGRLGPYRVLRELGEGAMGVVFEAEDTRLKRRIALKVLKPYWARTETAKKRFLLEARASANLVGDSIVPIYDVGEVEGVPYLTMALLHGETLESRLTRPPRLPIPVLVEYARQITRGLAVAHGQGVIHRDLKPANLWLEARAEGDLQSAAVAAPSTICQSPCASATIKILDFGLARCLHDDARITQSGIVVGTPAYMAPEQANGGAVDARSDLFSLGCILYRMATGVVPFQGKDTLAVFWALASKEAVPPSRLNPEIPQEVSDLILQLLTKDPANRPESAAALLPLLDRLPTQPRQPLPYRKMALACAACAALLLLVIFWWWPSLSRDAEPVVPARAVKKITSGQPALEVKKAAPRQPAIGLQFNGKALVEIPDFPLPVNGPYTLEAYVIPTGGPTARRQVVIGYGLNNRNIALEMSSYRRIVPTWRFSWVFPQAIGEVHAKSDQRFHLAAVFTGTEGALFVNGKTDVAGVQAKSANLEIPIVLNLGKDFVGTIEQVRISKTARYSGDFTPAERLAADDQTLALYHCNEGKGDTLPDLSGNGRHGKILGATWKLP